MAKLVLLTIVALTAQLAPGGTFIDDNGSPHEGSIEAISAAGLTNGCNPPTSNRFCPESPVKRGEMAAFFARALKLPVSPNDHFSDDDGHLFEGAINRIAEAGITVGCNPPANTSFCPDRDMTRGQMAAMLVRAFGYGPVSGDRFSDDNGSVFEDAIERLAAAGVTLGCNPPLNTRFCPDQKVTRAQLATFITRALGLTAIKPPPADSPGAQIWATSSPFNRSIPSNPRLDARSGAMSSFLSSQVVFDLYEYGIAIHYVDSSSPKVNVTCTANWGICPTISLNPIQVPSDTKPPPGSDGNTVLIDWPNRRAVSMHQPTKNANGSWSATWVTVADLLGSGVPASGGNGSGASHLAGVVELHEIQQGVIEHALVFSTSALCSGQFRYPARKTDGQSTVPHCIPAGARIQLDPTIDLSGLGLNKGEMAVARALQKYGAYAVDRGGAPMALYFQVAPDATSQTPGQVYRSAGLDRDYYRADDIPWNRLRVLASWNGA